MLNKATDNFKNKKKTQICIYYSGAGLQLYDQNNHAPVARTVGFAARGDDKATDYANGKRNIDIDEKVQKIEGVPNTTTIFICDTDRNLEVIPKAEGAGHTWTKSE